MLWMMLAAANPPAPVYLRCQIGAEGLVEMTIDEANGRASISIAALDRSIVGDAAFGPETVVVHDGPTTWTIDRVTLAARRSYDFSGAINEGRCEVQPAPSNRAF